MEEEHERGPKEQSCRNQYLAAHDDPKPDLVAKRRAIQSSNWDLIAKASLCHHQCD
jgi:hypothetical protein